MQNVKKKKAAIRIWAILIWLVIWQIAAMAADMPIFFVTPLEVIKRLGELIITAEFWTSALYTLLHIMAGFFLALVTAVVLASLASRYKAVGEFVAPPMLAIRSVPVVSFIILALICFSSKHLAILISFLMVLPILYSSILTGIKQTDRELLQMADVFRLTSGRRIRYIYIPQVYPYFMSACASAVGIAWKSGCAAEVIGIPQGSIGEKLQEAKIYLETPDLFAWTLLIVVLSMVTEKVIFGLIREGYKLSQRMTDRKEKPDETDRAKLDNIQAEGLGKSYGQQKVLDRFSIDIPDGKITVIMGESGCGKTTLLNILEGLEEADCGKVSGLEGKHIAAVFQEDRLLEHLSAEDNIRLTASEVSKEEIREGMQRTRLLSEQESGKSVADFSGGMKRRTALLRALLSDWDVLLLDEPFKGLDTETKAEVSSYLQEKTRGKTVLMVTHDEEEAMKMATGSIINLK